jgi:hypothetical protein
MDISISIECFYIYSVFFVIYTYVCTLLFSFAFPPPTTALDPHISTYMCVHHMHVHYQFFKFVSTLWVYVHLYVHSHPRQCGFFHPNVCNDKFYTFSIYLSTQMCISLVSCCKVQQITKCPVSAVTTIHFTHKPRFP